MSPDIAAYLDLFKRREVLYRDAISFMAAYYKHSKKITGYDDLDQKTLRHIEDVLNEHEILEREFESADKGKLHLLEQLMKDYRRKSE